MKTTAVTALGIAAHPLYPAWWTAVLTIVAVLFWVIFGMGVVFSGV